MYVFLADCMSLCKKGIPYVNSHLQIKMNAQSSMNELYLITLPCCWRSPWQQYPKTLKHFAKCIDPKHSSVNHYLCLKQCPRKIYIIIFSSVTLIRLSTCCCCTCFLWALFQHSAWVMYIHDSTCTCKVKVRLTY